MTDLPPLHEKTTRTAWPWLVAAGVAETGWIEGLAQSQSAASWTLAAIAAAASLACALGATRALPATAVYILFVAEGTLGTAVYDALSAGAWPSSGRCIWLILLLAGIAGLQRTSPA